MPNMACCKKNKKANDDDNKDAAGSEVQPQSGASSKAGDKDAKVTVQKVVIPKGMINPGETTIIEIPSNLQKQPIVVAKRKTSLDDVNYQNKMLSKQKKCDTQNQYQTKPPASYQGYQRPSQQNYNQQDLESTEQKEKEQFMRDLEEFQRARRKLLANASFLAGDKSH